ncbi:MAG: hypothetical protein KA184_15505 [Candidatus Hydrogenedentes bacterium]|nr:hypothetical protein [Candidatus Hydrogenedentota bacterium]
MFASLDGPRVFPMGSPPADVVEVADLRGASSDEKLAATVLQGLVNRGERAAVYLLLADWDVMWLDGLRASGQVRETVPCTLAALFQNHAPAYGKLILYDPSVPASISVAAMLASLEGGVVLCEQTRALAAPGKETIDLRGRWRTNVEAYRWAFDELWPRLDHQLLASYHPTACAHHLRDYLVRNRVFHLWVSGEEHGGGPDGREGEITLLRTVLEAAPANIPVLGFWGSGVDPGLGEYAGVGLAGEYGKFTVVSDWSSNLSFLSGAQADLDSAIRQYQDRVNCEPPDLEPGAVYVCYDVVESGDAPCYLQSRQWGVWQDARRGAIPVNWSMGPAILELAPCIAMHYYTEATRNDYIYMAISGADYCHPYRDFMSRTDDAAEAWCGYLDMTRRYLRQMRCRELGLYTDAWRAYERGKQETVTLRFLEAIPTLELVVLGMGRDDGVSADQANYWLGPQRAVVSHVMTRWPANYAEKTREENIAWLADDIRAYTPVSRPGFVHVMALSWAYGPSEIEEVHHRLGPVYRALTLPQFVRLYRRTAAEMGRQ